MKIFWHKTIAVAIGVLSITHLSNAQENAADIAQQLQNPLETMVAVPILHSFGLRASQNFETGYISSFQPIFPFQFEKFNVVNRIIWGFGYVTGIVEGTPMIP